MNASEHADLSTHRSIGHRHRRLVSSARESAPRSGQKRAGQTRQLAPAGAGPSWPGIAGRYLAAGRTLPARMVSQASRSASNAAAMVVQHIGTALSGLIILIPLSLAVMAEGVILHADDQVSAAPDSVENPTRLWKVRLIDGENDQPLEGLQILVPQSGDSPSRVLSTDADGLLEVPVPKGTAVSLQIESPGWWIRGGAVVGELSTGPQQLETAPPVARDPAAIVTHRVWRGTIVTGRLMRPDGQPAAGFALKTGVYINSQEWRKRLGMDLTWHSFDHGQWPNWSTTVTTDQEGRFLSTVPPTEARSWVRIGTTDSLFSNIGPTPLTPVRTSFAPSEWEFEGPESVWRERGGRLHVGDLRLEEGVTLRGRVLDAGGKGLAGVVLHTSGKHGPYAGRRTVSCDEGRFEFLPMHPGSFTIRPDARERDETEKVASRDVQAVFLPQSFALPDADEPVETTIQAVPHVTLEFRWVDRRAEKGPVAYYGAFRVTGQVPTEDGSTILWSGETERTRRDGKEILFVKVPRSIQDPILTLPADRVVTASYEDDLWIAGPGTVNLGDVTEPQRRIIYGDEPRER